MTFLRVKKMMIGVLCSALFMSIVPLNTGETVCADTFISFDDNTVTHNEFRSVENYEYNAEVNTLAQWTGHSNIEITFTNTGDETIHGKEAYNIERVILLYHGDIGCFFVGEKNIATNYIKYQFDDAGGYISELEDKTINILDLKICYSGALIARNIDPNTYEPNSLEFNNGYNIAIQFLASMPDISSVRAWNGEYYLYFAFGHYERSVYTAADFEDCCYIYTFDGTDFNVERDTNVEKTGIYTFYVPPIKEPPLHEGIAL